MKRLPTDRRKTKGSQQALPGIGASVIIVEGLLLLLLVLYAGLNTGLLIDSDLFLYAMGAFGFFILIGRFTPMLFALPDVRVTLECFAMIALITATGLWAGTDNGTLMNLYLLPVTLSALTLGRRETAGMFVATVGCRMWLSNALGKAVFTTGFALNLFVELAPLLLLAIAVTALVYSAQVARGQVRALTYQDELTGLFNMRAFARLLNSEHRSMRDADNKSYTVLKADVIEMQRINDEYGFETGNRVLQHVAEALRRSTRMNDMIARYGGDEFVLLLRNADRKTAEILMNRIHQNLFGTTFPVGHKTLKLQVALGAATYPADADNSGALMVAAHKAMEQNKLFQKNLSAGHAKASVLKNNAETTIS